MEIVQLRSDEAAIRRFLDDLWIPFNRELEGVTDTFGLAEEVDLVAEELEFRLDRLESEGKATWIAINGGVDEDSIADADGEFIGYIATETDECPSTFDRPDRLYICDLYVHEAHRGSGLARELVECASAWGRENGCEELELDVDIGNDRAKAFYNKLGFEPTGQTMVVGMERD